MYGDARLGTLDWVEWVTLTNGSLDYTLPLVRQSIQRQPMFSFPQTTQQGPIDRPSLDPRLSYVSLLNDLTGGLGYQTIEPTDSLARYFWGSLDTRFKGYVTLPPKTTVSAATLPSWPATVGAYTARCRVATAASGHRFLYVLGPPGGATALSWAYDLTAAGAAATSIARRLFEVAEFNNVIVATDDIAPNGIYTSTDGTTFTVRENTKWWVGLAVHDNKLWSYSKNDAVLYSCVDPTQGVFVAPSTNPNGWRAMSDTLILLPTEFVKEIVEWRDNQGQAALYLVTSHRIIGFDDESGEWATYADLRALGTSKFFASFVMWPRDRQLYGVPGVTEGNEAARFVLQFTGTASEVGPAHSGQLPSTYAARAVWLAVSTHHVFLWHTDDLTSNSVQGVLAYNEQGGWHPVFTGPTSGKRIMGGAYDRGSLVTVYTDGTLDVVSLPDSATPPLLLSPTTQATSGSITLAEIDCGAPGVWKLGAYLYVDARKSDNSYGLPANNSLTVNAPLVDGVALGPGIVLSSANTFPAIIGLDTAAMSLVAQGGMAFRRFQARLALSKLATTDQSPRLVDVALYYDLWREQRYAYQFAIDFTDTAWGYPRGLAGGLDRGAAIAELLSLQLTKRRYTVTFGGSGDRQVVIPAAEIIVASRADDNQRGIFPCTIRDVSAPASG